MIFIFKFCVRFAYTFIFFLINNNLNDLGKAKHSDHLISLNLEKKRKIQALGTFQSLSIRKWLTNLINHFMQVYFDQDISLALIVSITLAFGFFILVSKQSEKTFSNNYILLILKIILIMTQVYSTYWFYKTNPGICSHSLPIINQLEMIRFKKYFIYLHSFCGKCKCIQTITIKHC